MFVYGNSATPTWSFVALKFPIAELIPAVYSAKIDAFTDQYTATLPSTGSECPAMTVKLNNRQEIERLEVGVLLSGFLGVV